MDVCLILMALATAVLAGSPNASSSQNRPAAMSLAEGTERPEREDSSNLIKRDPAREVPSTANPIEDPKHFASLHKVLGPQKVYLTVAEKNSVACIQFEMDESFEDCNAKHPNVTVDLVVSHPNFPVMKHTLRYNHTELCRPVHAGRKGYFCFQYDNNKIPKGSKIAFERMFITRVVLDCPSKAYKMSSQSFGLLKIPTETTTAATHLLTGCPALACYKWLANDKACISKDAESGTPFPQRKINKGTEILLILGVASATGALVLGISHFARLIGAHAS